MQQYRQYDNRSASAVQPSRVGREEPRSCETWPPVLLAEARKSVLAWLMTSTEHEEFRIRQMMGLVGMTIGLPYRALAFSVAGGAENGGGGRRASHHDLDAICGCWDDDFCCRTGNRLYVLRSNDRNRSSDQMQAALDIVRAIWAKVGAPDRLLIGVGTQATDGRGLKRSIDEADVCLSVLERGDLAASAQSVEVLWSDQAEIYQLLRLIRDEADLRGFVRRWLGSLLDYDQVHGTCLVRTLEVYLECGGNMRETARLLYLHPHGVRYRLERIFDLLGVEEPAPIWKLNAFLAVKASKLISSGQVPAGESLTSEPIPLH